MGKATKPNMHAMLKLVPFWTLGGSQRALLGVDQGVGGLLVHRPQLLRAG